MKNRIFALSLVASVSVLAGVNLLKNGNFEELDANGMPVGWSGFTPEVWSASKGTGINGSNAMMFNCSEIIDRSGPSQKIKLEPGKKNIYLVNVHHEG